MVFNWFQRGLASPPPANEAPPAQESPEADAAPVAATPAVAPSPQPEEPSPAAAGESPPAPAEAVDTDALAWARQAYARLKAQQAATAASAAAPSEEPPPEAPTAAESAGAEPFEAEQVGTDSRNEPVSGPPETSPPEMGEPEMGEPAAAGLSLLEQAAAQREQRRQELLAAAEQAGVAAAASPPPPPSPPVAAAEGRPKPVAPLAEPGAAAAAEPSLGAFDAEFTWSAEVLAAQGRRVEEVSLEEIDWLTRLRRGLEKTRKGFVAQLLENLGDDPLSDETLEGLESTLLRADVGVQATDRVLAALRQRLNEEVVDPAEGLRFLKEQLRQILQEPIQASGEGLLAPQKGRLNVWLLVGVNGVGKTTTLGKLANLAVRSGYSCLIAAADTFRAAAVEQVRVWGERSGVAVVSNPSANADPAAVVYDAIGAAKAKGIELVLVDTAGRLQTKHNLMEELAKVRRIVDKLAPEAVVQSLLVLDSSQGQNGLRQAMAFASAAGLTGVVLTKLDGSARGGVALAVASEAGLPIRFVGAGETIRDLRPFNSFEFVEALLAG